MSTLIFHNEQKRGEAEGDLRGAVKMLLVSFFFRS